MDGAEKIGRAIGDAQARLKRWMEKASEKAGIERTGLHGLRHSAISLLRSGGADPAVVQKRMAGSRRVETHPAGTRAHPAGCGEGASGQPFGRISP